MSHAELQQVVVLGATGSVGTSTLDVLDRNREQYSVYALSAHRNVELLASQCQQFEPVFAAMSDPGAAAQLQQRLQRAGSRTSVLSGPDSLERIAVDSRVTSVMAAVVGYAGLAPVMAAATAGKRILLANKEAMVVAGELLVATARENGATILPVDSEHNAIFQCLPAGDSTSWRKEIVSLVLTASGGPFREWSAEQMERATVEQALAHPNWDMGPKISIDSATMMNKGLEIIEASHLFGVDEQEIEVVVHPQSVVHSMVRFADGSVIAQMGNADMRTPIAHALGWPERLASGVAPIDFTRIGSLQFEPPDEQRFPCLRLARLALGKGGSAPAILNAANEVAVENFLKRRIGFADIARINQSALAQIPLEQPASVEHLAQIDRRARNLAVELVDSASTSTEIT